MNEKYVVLVHQMLLEVWQMPQHRSCVSAVLFQAAAAALANVPNVAACLVAMIDFTDPAPPSRLCHLQLAAACSLRSPCVLSHGLEQGNKATTSPPPLWRGRHPKYFWRVFSSYS